VDPKELRSPPDGMGLPSMMKQMMAKMCGGSDVGQAVMCQGMMTPLGKASEAAEYATPELRNVFEEWARGVADEVLAALKRKGALDLATLADALKFSPESTLSLLYKLVREGKVTIGSIRVTGEAGAAV
jgi:hypothetical protein